MPGTIRKPEPVPAPEPPFRDWPEEEPFHDGSLCDRCHKARWTDQVRVDIPERRFFFLFFCAACAADFDREQNATGEQPKTK